MSRENHKKKKIQQKISFRRSHLQNAFHACLHNRRLELEPHVGWWDNFSKMWRMRMVGLSPQAMKSCLWTCVAYKKYAFPNEVSMDHKRTAAGEVIPGMPTNPFDNVDELVTLMQGLTQNEDGSMPHLFETSLMTVWDANRLPLAANLERMPEPHRSTTAAARDRSDDLYPRGLERENIGSNDGLARIMRRFYEQRHLGNPDCTKYAAVSADVNIFDRMIKVSATARALIILPFRCAMMFPTVASCYAKTLLSGWLRGTITSMLWN
jgi:hypothetical protein